MSYILYSIQRWCIYLPVYKPRIYGLFGIILTEFFNLKLTIYFLTVCKIAGYLLGTRKNEKIKKKRKQLNFIFFCTRQWMTNVLVFCVLFYSWPWIYWGFFTINCSSHLQSKNIQSDHSLSTWLPNQSPTPK